MEKLARAKQVGRELFWFGHGVLRKDYSLLETGGLDPAQVVLASPEDGAAKEHSSRGLQVISWNIQRGYEAEEILHSIEHLDSDILLLQESPISSAGVFSENLASRLGYWGVYYPSIVNKGFWQRNFSSFGQATLSRYPITRYEIIPLPKIYDWEKMSQGRVESFRHALYTQIDLEERRLGVYNLHLDPFTTPQRRRTQLEPVIEHINDSDSEVLIVGGDFNTALGRREAAIKSLQTLGFNYASKDSRPLLGLLDLEHFLIKGVTEVKATTQRKAIGSDHKPIKIEVFF